MKEQTYVYDITEDLLGQITLQEKVTLHAGTNRWYTVPSGRLL